MLIRNTHLYTTELKIKKLIVRCVGLLRCENSEIIHFFITCMPLECGGLLVSIYCSSCFKYNSGLILSLRLFWFQNLALLFIDTYGLFSPAGPS